ncbi:hypothetical protein H1R20_g7119, partial [Candolleomyces eurysporus]
MFGSFILSYARAASTNTELRNIQTILQGYRAYRKDRHGTFYLKSEYERHRKALSRKSEASRYDYVAEEKKKLSPRFDRLYEFRSWESQQSRLKRDDIETRRGNRSDAIKEKLKELGWLARTCLTSWGGSLLVPHAKGVKPLTEREWEKIKPEITGVLDKRRTENKVNKRRAILQDRTNLLSLVYKYYISNNRSVASVFPSYHEVAKTEPFRTLIYDTPSDKKLTQADFLAHLDELPKIFKSWLETTTNFLLGLISQESETCKSVGKAKKTAAKGKGKGKGKEKETAPVDATIFDLATTLFECNLCKSILPYHQALRHGCFAFRILTPENPTLDESADPNTVWNGTGIAEYHQVASDCASEIITILGKNPKTATGEELDEARQRLECVRCLGHTPAGRPKRLIMDWRNAVVHEVLSHTSEEAQAEQKHSGSTKQWEIVEGKRLTATYKREVVYDAPGKETWRSLLCVQCGLWELDEKNREVKRVNQWGWTERAIPPGESTCASNHDMSMGTYRADHPGFRSVPYTVTL